MQIVVVTYATNKDNDNWRDTKAISWKHFDCSWDIGIVPDFI